MSLFVTFEGGEGSGKSTQAHRLAARLRAAGVDVREIREPGSTRLGWQVRDWLKRGPGAGETISHGAELFLFAAARAELVGKVVRPILDRPDAVIIADRYGDSTTAYQGYGRRIPLERVEVVNDLAAQGIRPNLTILLDCEPEVGLRRVGSFQMKLPLDPGNSAFGTGEAAERKSAGRTQQGAGFDTAERDEEGARFEEEPPEFHERVRAGYLALAEREPLRWLVLDADRPADTIAQDVLGAVVDRLPPRAREMVEAPAARRMPPP